MTAKTKTDMLLIKDADFLGGSLDKISQLIDHLNSPAAYNRIICLDDGKPVDYLFLKVNEAYEKLTGLPNGAVLGKKFSEVFPQDKDDPLSDRISLFANVALTGIPSETERFIKHFNRWFRIHLYSPEKGCFLQVFEEVSERKRLEADLGLSSQNIKQLTYCENGLWVLDSKGVTTYVNTKMASMLGYSINELIGEEFLNFLDERGKTIALEAGIPFKMINDKRLELEFLHSLGTPVYVQVETSQVNDECGHLTSIVLNVTDISDHKCVEQALSKSQKKYRGLFQHLTDGFACCQVLFDKSGKTVDYVFSDVNDSFRHLTGLKDKPILGLKMSQVFPEIAQLFSDWTQIYGKLSLKGKSLFYEMHFEDVNKYFSIYLYCPENGYLAIILQDITQRKKAESALKQSERKYKKLANSIADLFFAVDSSLRFTYWNNASERYTGVAVKDAVGKRVYEVFGKDKTAKRAVKVYLEVMRTRRAQTFTDKLPKGEGNFTFEMSVYPTGNGISVFARDITERLKLQQALEKYTVHLEELVKTRTEKLKGVERLAAIGETAGMIGHDIRNPLQSIIGEGYLANEELKQLPESLSKNSLAESIHAIEEQTTYINKIVTDLQDYAKSLEPMFQEVKLEETIKCVISTLDIPAAVKISYFIEEPFPTLMTDSSFIKRILTNLTLNGVQAMQKSGGELTINAFPRTKTVIIAVSDNGVGIPKEIREKIFKPLFTTKSKGQGFGLAVVKKLVEALNGSISFETEFEKGTTFILEIPSKPK